jgi:nucleoside-diphosphate kinase
VAVERTFSIIKPDAVERNLIGKIVARFEDDGLRVVAMRRQHLSLKEAEGFYAVHAARPFFGELTEYMSRSPVVLMVLEGEDAVTRNREIMGATNPAQATSGTIRKMFGKSIGENSVHGSDSLENAGIEIAYFFRGTELN